MPVPLELPLVARTVIENDPGLATFPDSTPLGERLTPDGRPETTDQV